MAWKLEGPDNGWEVGMARELDGSWDPGPDIF